MVLDLIMKQRVRAIIIKDEKVLLIKRTKDDLIYWVFPGGAVENEENNNQALIRECKEELGVDIKVNDLLLEMASQKPETQGQQEFFYFCDIIGGKLGTGQGPEFQPNSIYVGDYKIEWKNVKDLKNIDLKPKEIQNLLT